MSHAFLSRTTASLLLAAALPFVAAPAAAASAYSAVVVLGDSLSDDGNLFALTGGNFPPAPYDAGRFSNGPVAVERLADALGAPLVNLAYGGATTGLFNGNFAPQTPGLGATGLLSQLGSYAKSLAGAPAPSDALYVVWGGANDFLHPVLPPGPTMALAVANLAQTVTGLYLMGARDFLLPLMPDLGATPRGLSGELGTPEEGSALSLTFNNLLTIAYSGLELQLPGASFTVFDTFGAQHRLIDGAPDNGLTNVTDACLTKTGVCATPDSYLYWDDIHPTATTHSALAQQMFAQLQPVPEPGAFWLMLAGGAGLLAWRRRQAA